MREADSLALRSLGLLRSRALEAEQVLSEGESREEVEVEHGRVKGLLA